MQCNVTQLLGRDDTFNYGKWLWCSREPKYFDRPKILFHRLRKKLPRQLVGAFDDQGLYNRHSLSNYILNSETAYNLKYILAIFNSKLANYWFVKKFGLLMEVGGFKILQLPIRRIDFTTPAAERAALREQAIALYEDALAADHETTGLLAFTADQPTDIIHDLLAHLAERMIALNRDKQQRSDNFYLDLEGVTDADAYAKLQKGKQGRTLWRAEACRPYVAEGSYTTHSLEESLCWSEDAYKAFVKKLAGKVSGLSDLVSVYRKHAPAYHRARAAHRRYGSHH